MIINAINQYKSLEPSFKRASKSDKDAPSPALVKDTVTLSSEKENLRSDLINSIKSKIKRGFYSSESVLEDLSESFAKAMNPS